MEELHVDGGRPAVARVAALPRSWTTGDERAVLFAMACDSYDGETCAPGYDNLAAWAGVQRSSITKILSRLTKPTARRPSLLARELTTAGRNRTVWRLLIPEPAGGAGRFDRTESDEGYPQPADETGRINRPAVQAGSPELTGAQPAPNRPATPAVNRPAPQAAPVTPLDPPVVDVATYGPDARELEGQTDVYEQIAAASHRELHLADPPDPDPTGLELLTGRAPCPNPAHSPRRRRGAWTCPQCVEARSA